MLCMSRGRNGVSRRVRALFHSAAVGGRAAKHHRQVRGRRTNESQITKDSPVKTERAHYFDAGLQQKIVEGLTVGIDGYYKSAHSVLDEGQFGQALILSSFNYKRGELYGGELTANYDHGPWSAYLNAAYGWARGTNASSAQFLFDRDELDYIRHNWVFLDHDQRFTGSAGVSYT